MSRKFLEALFRNKRLLLLPPLLIPLIVGAVSFVTTPLYYEGWTAVWLSQPTYLAATDQDNRYLSPAQNAGMNHPMHFAGLIGRGAEIRGQGEVVGHG